MSQKYRVIIELNDEEEALELLQLINDSKENVNLPVSINRFRVGKTSIELGNRGFEWIEL